MSVTYLAEVPDVALGIDILLQFLNHLLFARSYGNHCAAVNLQRISFLGDFI